MRYKSHTHTQTHRGDMPSAEEVCAELALEFEDIVSLQTTSAVYKMSSCGAVGPLALKCVLASSGSRSLQHEWHVLEALRGVSNITEPYALQSNVSTSAAIFPKGEEAKTVLIQRFFKAAPVHKLFCMFPRFEEGVVRGVVARLLSILGEVHARSVVYVDLKLPNILLLSDGSVRLVDFGSSVVLSDISEEDGCAPFLRGTVHVRAPELFGQDRFVPHPLSIDYWALGVCTYELLCGQPLYGSFDAASGLTASTTRATVTWPPHVTEDARTFVEGLLQVNPECRLGFHGGCDAIKKHSFLANTELCAQLPEEYAEEVDMQTLGL